MVNKLTCGIVLTLSAEPLELRAPPLRFLLRLRQLAGHSRQLVTYTKSLATIMGVCPNTIRNWRNALEDHGYIYWMTAPRTGLTTIYLTAKVEPPSRRARMEAQRQIDLLPAPLPWQKPKPVILREDPKAWWKYPTKSAFCVGGAQQASLIKTRKILAQWMEPVGGPARCFHAHPS